MNTADLDDEPCHGFDTPDEEAWESDHADEDSESEPEGDPGVRDNISVQYNTILNNIVMYCVIYYCNIMCNNVQQKRSLFWWYIKKYGTIRCF
jgi:prolipoprotein diacylglyceryltransferase